MKNLAVPTSKVGISLTFFSTFVALLCLALAGLPTAGLAYNASAEFSTSLNPNGVWSYGWSTTLGSSFNLNTSNTVAAYGIPGLGGWLNHSSSASVPYSLRNDTASPITIANFTTYQPGQLSLNPGINGEYAIVRWTAPSSEQFSITATFSGMSSIGDSADVHILLNGVSIFNSNVIGSPSPVSFSGLQNLEAGDKIDFVAGYGSNGNDAEDTTGLGRYDFACPGTQHFVSNKSRYRLFVVALPS